MFIKELLQTINYRDFIGDPETEIRSFISFDAGNPDGHTLMWLNEVSPDQLMLFQNGTLILPEFDRSLAKPSCNYIVVENPRSVFRQVLQQWFSPEKKFGISASARIAAGVELGEKIFIGENVVIEAPSSLGEGCSIGHNTVIHSNTRMGKDVIVGSNCTIGGTGFGYEKNEKGRYEAIPHIGGVVLGNNVEIGNNTCIDRGVLNNTTIGESVKIDNLVHIAHGVQIGPNTLVIAHAMVGGSTVIGDNVWISPAASLLNKIKVGNDAVIGMGSVVIKDVERGQTIAGNPGKPLEKK
jgi:UDP-3-O-[3-hydroxymyristoyl] glucosamine N-acyltransferase